MKKIIFGAVLVLGVAMAHLHAQITPGRLLRPIRQDPNAPVAQSAPAASAETTKKAAAPAPIVSPLVTALDTNRNAIIEAAEMINAPEALKKLDANKDGQLTIEEYLGKGESTNSPIIKVLDVNHDGIIDAKEIAKSASALRMLDKNFDGKLTLNEYKPVAAPVEPEPAKSSQ
jgi:hypothetical protein